MDGKTGRLPKSARIKKPGEIRNILRQGKKFSTFGAKLFVADNDFIFNRVAFAFRRHYGNSVSRNLSRRISREVYRRFMRSLQPGHDLIFMVFPGNDIFSAREAQFSALLSKAGILREKI